MLGTPVGLLVVPALATVKVVTGPDGLPRLDVGSPMTYVDILDDSVDVANER